MKINEIEFNIWEDVSNKNKTIGEKRVYIVRQFNILRLNQFRTRLLFFILGMLFGIFCVFIQFKIFF